MCEGLGLLLMMGVLMYAWHFGFFSLCSRWCMCSCLPRPLPALYTKLMVFFVCGGVTWSDGQCYTLLHTHIPHSMTEEQSVAKRQAHESVCV